MKKICMVAYTNYLSDPRPRRDAETLARRGDQVDFIALAEGDRPAVEMIQGVRLLRVRQSRYRGGSGLSYGMAYMRFICATAWKILRLHSREHYNVIFVHSMPDLLVLAGVIPRMFGARLVLDIREMMPELYMSKFGILTSHPLIRLMAWQEQLSIRLADRVICVHHPHLEVLCKRGARREKITVLPNVPDPLAFRIDGIPSSAGDAFRVVYHGTILRRLGLDLAVLAFVKAANACPGARLEIYGDGDASEELAAQIEASGMKDRIYFSKKMFRVEEIAEKIKGASVGIIPNRRDVATDYMLPVKMLEYVHLGIPVIAPRLLVIQYYFSQEQVAYYEPEDVYGLAATLCRLYGDAGERAERAERAAEFLEEFGWETLKEELFKAVDGESA